MKFVSGNKHGRTQTNKQIVGLRASDIPSYNNLCPSDKTKVKDRAIRVMGNMIVDYVETSILPPNMIRKLWEKHKPVGRGNIVIREAFDQGSVFHLEK